MSPGCAGARGLQVRAAPGRRCRQPDRWERGSAAGPGTRRGGLPPGGGGTGEHLPAPPQGPGSKPAGRRKAQEEPAGPGAVPANRSEPCPGPRWPDPSARTPSPEPIPPDRPLPRSPRGAPASCVHLRGLEPGRPGLAPLRARSPLACAAAAAASLPGHLREGCGGAGPHMQPAPRGRGISRAHRPPGAGPRMQIKMSRGLASLSSGAVMNNSAVRWLAANQKAATALRAAARPGSGRPRRGDPLPAPGRAGHRAPAGARASGPGKRLPCRVRPPPPGSARPPAPRGAGT